MSADNSVCIVETPEGFLVKELHSEFWDLCETPEPPDPEKYARRIYALFADATKCSSLEEAEHVAELFIQDIEASGGYVEYDTTLLPALKKGSDAPLVSG